MISITRLPEYTTERYYILSELEQKTSAFLYIDEIDNNNNNNNNNSNNNNNNSNNNNGFSSFYVLWNISGVADKDEHLSRLKRDIDNLFKNSSNVGGYSLLSIEVLIRNRKDWDSTKILIEDTIRWIASTYQHIVNYIIIGVADDAAAAPALESILDYYNKIYDEELLNTYTVNIIGLSRLSFLGHNGDQQDPDAKSGVFQLRVSSHCSFQHESNQKAIDFDAWCHSVSIVAPKKAIISSQKKEAEIFTWLTVLIIVFISWYACYKK